MYLEEIVTFRSNVVREDSSSDVFGCLDPKSKVPYLTVFSWTDETGLLPLSLLRSLNLWYLLRYEYTAPYQVGSSTPSRDNGITSLLGQWWCFDDATKSTEIRTHVRGYCNCYLIISSAYRRCKIGRDLSIRFDRDLLGVLCKKYLL